MTIDGTSLSFLTSERGAVLLDDLRTADLSEANTLALVSKLRKRYSATETGTGLSLARLRQKAEAKFGADAQALFFTDDALQQASDPLVRRYRAQSMGGLRVLDVGCGIGADSIAFARAGAQVHGIDIDPVRIDMARLNAAALGLRIDFSVQDAHEIDTRDYDLVFFDPARRAANGKRIYDVERYIPPLSLIRQWQAPQIMVKLSPGVDLAQLTDYDGLLRFIGVNGDLKEALLHVGIDQIGTVAVRLQADAVYEWQRKTDEPVLMCAEPQSWLCEPDPAIIRAGLVRELALEQAGLLLDEQIAYFTTAQKPDSVWLRAWQILEWMPFNLKRLRAALRARDIGPLTVKKRGSPITPEVLKAKLKLKGSQAATVVMTRYQDAPIVMICAEQPT